MEEGLLTKTGKPLSHWIKIVTDAKLDKHGEMLKFLKENHGFTHGYANFVALKAKKSDAGSHDADNLVANQYAKKESLKPIYDALYSFISNLGPDVEVVPKMAAVSFKTGKQFALVQPSTKTRVDLGLKLRNREPEGKLEHSGPFGAMCTHRVQLIDVKDFSDNVKTWITEAYNESK